MSREVKRLVYFSVLSLLAALAVSIFGPKGASAAGKKPVPAPVWGAQIEDYGNLAGMAPGHVYTGSNDTNVRVTVQKSSTGGVVTSSTIHFFIYANTDPPTTYATFHDVALTDLVAGDPNPLGVCSFPPGLPATDPCAVGFINSWHPKPGYEHLLFYLVFNADIEDQTLFPIQPDPYQWTGDGAMQIFFWNCFDSIIPGDPEPYESVTLGLRSLCSEYPKGLWIRHPDANTWEITFEQQVFDFTQHYNYATSSVGRNGRTTWTTKGYEPLKGQAGLSYRIKLLRNPS